MKPHHLPLDVSAMTCRRSMQPNNRSWRLVTLFLLMATAGHASADWRVTDQVTHKGLDRIDNTLKDQTNKRIEELRDQQNIGDSHSSTQGASDKPGDPGVILQKDKPATIQSAQSVEELRCGEEPGANKVVLRDRWTVCIEIVKTELAQYNYALAMREVAIQRQGRLKTIEDSRSRLNQGYQDVGKLQSNSNELLALLARMEADKQQYRTYMDAYAARLNYLQALRESLGQQAINGKNTLGQIAVGASALAALKVGLDGQKTSQKSVRFK